MALWKISGGKLGEREALAETDVVTIGWGDLGDLTSLAERADQRHSRSVEWQREVPRSAIEQDLLFSLGASLAVSRNERNDAERRFRAMAGGGGEAAAVSAATGGGAAQAVNIDDEASIDLGVVARDGIRAFIARRFAGHDLARLVAAVLEAQGYRTRVSPEGADWGVDIIADTGPFGFEAPRLAVQVKSGDGPSDVKVIRELQGVMKGFGADRGLFVSWGGYRNGVAREAARAFFEIRLWDSDDLIRELQAIYDRLPDEMQAELPLKRIWTLVIEEEA